VNVRSIEVSTEGDPFSAKNQTI